MTKHVPMIKFVLVLLCTLAWTAQACNEIPIAIMNAPDYLYIPAGDAYPFSDDGSYDPDDDPPGQTGSQQAQDAITDWQWWTYSDSMGWRMYSEHSSSMSPSWRYPGHYRVELDVKGDDGDEDWSDTGYGAEVIDLYVVGVEKIQYEHPFTGWQDVSGTVYVMKGDVVNFRAVSTNGDPWPDENPVWGGSAGAYGTGATKNIFFDTVSTSTTDYKTITVACGNTEETVNVIVFDLEGTLTPDDNFDGRSSYHYGVGETVDLACTITPSGVTAGQIGEVHWVQWFGGVGSLSDVTDDGTAVYDAGPYSGTPNLVLMVGPYGASTGSGKAYDKYVVVPSDGYCVRRSGMDIFHLQGYLSVSMMTNFYITPDYVSFGNVDFKEDSAQYYGTGMLAGLANHSAWSTWYDIIGNGENKVDLPSNMDAAEMTSWEITDVSQYSAGTGYWDIPWKYKVDAVEGTITTVRQEFRTFSNGDHGVKKDGEGWYDVNHSDPDQTTGWY